MNDKQKTKNQWTTFIEHAWPDGIWKVERKDGVFTVSFIKPLVIIRIILMVKKILIVLL